MRQGDVLRKGCVLAFMREARRGMTAWCGMTRGARLPALTHSPTDSQSMRPLSPLLCSFLCKLYSLLIAEAPRP